MTLMNKVRAGSNLLKTFVGLSRKTLHSVTPIAEENRARYRKGGYHPVKLGDIFNDERYRVVSKLGYGAYSTVWLAVHTQTKQHVALKILTADCYGDGKDTFELEILRHIGSRCLSHAGANHILLLLDEFKHQGPNGQHVCLVFKAMGPDMSSYRRLFPKSKIPLHLMKDVSRQLLLALSCLHDTCRVIHTDIKPQNILIETSAINQMFREAPSEVFSSENLRQDPAEDYYVESIQVSSAEEDITSPNDLSVRLADFGTASWYDRHLTEWIQPQMLRAPEVILKADWDRKVDIWNLGLIIWELAMGQLLFDGTWTANGQYEPEAHLAQMAAVLGHMPSSLLDKSQIRDRYFDADGQLRITTKFSSRSLEQLCTSNGCSDQERRNFLDFVGSMVKLDPEERLDASELLKSSWIAEEVRL